ncbi:MAG: hypothetical protein IPK16_13150 [Anaerolineales bacterium]|nr:hypothetical protein [Anaerolineales bacterium]
MKQVQPLKVISCGLLVALLLTLWPAQMVRGADEAVDAGKFTQYNVQGSPKNLFLETDNRIWFTLPAANKIGLLTGVAVNAASADAPALQYFDTGAGTTPYDLVYYDGFIWFTLLGSNQIGRLNPANGVIKTYNIPTANSEPTGITTGGGTSGS